MTSSPVHPSSILSSTADEPTAVLSTRLTMVWPDFGAGIVRRALLLIALTWPTLLLLCLFAGVAVGGTQVPFLYDIAAHTRFLAALPALVLADIPIGSCFRNTVEQFLRTDLVTPEDDEKFSALVADALRLGYAPVAKVAILVLAFLGSLASYQSRSEQGVEFWNQPLPDHPLTTAGYWYIFVALPIFQFFVLQWLYRAVVWARLLWGLTQLNLWLTATHPDAAGGLGFLGKGAISFGIVVFALSASLAGAAATRILFVGVTWQELQAPYIALLLIALLFFIGPLFVFTPLLARVKRRGLREYAALASRYTQMFEDKWVGGSGVARLDASSLRDLGFGAAKDSYLAVKAMRIVPIALRDVSMIVLCAAIPAVPLLATVMPVGDIFKKLLHLIA